MVVNENFFLEVQSEFSVQCMTKIFLIDNMGSIQMELIVLSGILSRKARYKDVHRRTIEIP